MIINKYELARKLGISHQAVYKWFNGKALPRADKLKKIAALTGLSMDELLRIFMVKNGR